MSRELASPRQEALRQLLIERRLKAGLTQTEVSRRMGRHDSFVSTVERGQHRLTLLEFLDYARAVGFNAPAFVRRLDSMER
jgi:transcriptional regulator with XRE-family HTH domain